MIVSCPGTGSSLWTNLNAAITNLQNADYETAIAELTDSLGEIGPADHTHNTKRVTVAVVLDPRTGSGPSSRCGRPRSSPTRTRGCWRAMRTLREEHGFAVPLALAVIAIIAGFSAVAIALATHNVDRSSRDRVSVRALAAADAGLDTAAYRMNKALVASRVDGLVPGGLMALTQETRAAWSWALER